MADDRNRSEHVALLEEFIAIMQRLAGRGTVSLLPQDFVRRCLDGPADTLSEARYRVDFLRALPTGGPEDAEGGMDCLRRVVVEIRACADPLDGLRRLATEFPSALAKVRRQSGLSPVPVNGSRAHGLELGYFEAPLRDGTLGYFQRRSDDCLQAAIASCLQVPPHQVPDLRIAEQSAAGKEPEEIERGISEQMSRWVERLGVTIMIHPVPPTSERRWIGVAMDEVSSFSDHCLLMSGRECLFDPAHALAPEDKAWCLRDPADIDYGITIERR